MTDAGHRRVDQVLSLLHPELPVSRATIADKLGFYPAQIGKTLMALERQGYAKRLGGGLWLLNPEAPS